MKFRVFCIFSVAFILTAFASCSDDDDTKSYMDGTLTLDVSMPRFVAPGEIYSITASGITAPDETAVGYYFSSSASGNVRDTILNAPFTYVYEIPDTLGSFSMSIVAFPVESSDKYYTSYGSFDFAIVSDDPLSGSLANINPREDEQYENVYGRSYGLVEVSGKEWLRGNLSRVDRDADGKEIFGRSYAGCKAMQNIFGAYYTWNEAMTACPEGWHLPSEAEWVDLLKASGAPETLQAFESSPSGAGNLMVKGFFNGTEMWYYYRGVNITDASISAIPVGYATESDGGWTYTGYQDYAVFWTSDEYEGKGVYRYIYKEYDSVFVGMAGKTGFAASVRCVR